MSTGSAATSLAKSSSSSCRCRTVELKHTALLVSWDCCWCYCCSSLFLFMPLVAAHIAFTVTVTWFRTSWEPTPRREPTRLMGYRSQNTHLNRQVAEHSAPAASHCVWIVSVCARIHVCMYAVLLSICFRCARLACMLVSHARYGSHATVSPGGGVVRGCA
jgi:hypothetical protein